MRFALAGNPNSGKTTLFNTLTGSSARVGNWPGVTVDKKEGVYKCRRPYLPPDVPPAAGKAGNGKIRIVDLPGIYSLSPYTPEEVIARQFIVEEKPDLIINIVDATSLERNLYLTTQLLEMDIPVVVALNMMDVIRREGAEIDAAALSGKLGVPVVPISALNACDARMLMGHAVQTLGAWQPVPGSRQCAMDFRPSVAGSPQSPIAPLYRDVLQRVAAHGIEHPVFHTVKLLENDAIELLHDTGLTTAIQNLKLQFEHAGAARSGAPQPAADYEAEIADLRYRFITDEVKPAVVKRYRNRSLSQSEKIDRLLTHRIWGLPAFLCILFAVFHLIFASDFLFLKRLGVLAESIPSLGVLLQGYTEELQTLACEQLTALLQSIDTAPWAAGLLVNGLANGVFSVLTFLPQILLLFLFLSILEDTGYMARVAFLMDRPLRRFGLSGKAILPMLMGFGCSVPAMMGTRTLDNIREKRLTLMLIPFFSCGAKLAIWSIIVAAIFPDNADFVVFAIYAVGIAVAVMAALALKKTVFKKSLSNFVLELPVYRLPRLKNTSLYLWDKLKGFLITVTTIVAAATIVIWFLQNFNFRLDMLDAGDSVHSILGQIGSAIHWIFVPLGFGQGPEAWKLIVAILTGLIAKELVAATMGILYIPGLSGEAAQTQEGETSLIATLAALSVFSPLTAMTFMIFNLLSIPCFAAVATAFAELKSAKWTLFTLFFWFATAWTVSFLVYQAGSLLGEMNAATAAVLLLALAIVGGSILYAASRKSKKKGRCAGCDECNGKLKVES
ncbi:MAG: ferrous iron transport protein B [Prevotellaceae bacterium]|jgi:ferrous iron transport protein B|nr:ferrous iron transport protein B [Prevotellaceae bacterium]